MHDVGPLSGASLARYAQRDRNEPLALSAREVVGLGGIAEPVPPPGTDGHGGFAAADAQRRSAAAVLHELPSGRVQVGEARKPLGGFEPREPRRLPGLDATEERGECQVEPPKRLLQGVAAEFDRTRTDPP